MAVLTEVVAQHPEEGGVRVGGDPVRTAIHVQGVLWHGPSPLGDGSKARNAARRIQRRVYPRSTGATIVCAGMRDQRAPRYDPRPVGSTAAISTSRGPPAPEHA